MPTLNQTFNPVVAVVGLGYVGLPLAVEFGKKFQTIGYDLSSAKIADYRECRDPTGEVAGDDLKAASFLEFTTDPSGLAIADYVVVAVPTPVDQAHKPDFSPLVSASISVGTYIKKDAIVVYESTVYPGATEEVCIPALERASGMQWLRDFHVGYSPERINPGDKGHTLTKIVKVVAGDTPDTLEKVALLYSSIVSAGLHKASTIKVAEAAKVIENTQRDLNIALMNELAIIFDKLDIDTSEVLAAASTKWNFLNFKPGLVGGHCIGVDPYYLTHKAEMLGYHPEVVRAGRRINDGMSKFIAEKTIKLMIQSGKSIKGARVNILGLTFKENCKDLRNSKVPEIVSELHSFGIEVAVHDPIAEPDQAMHEYGLQLRPKHELSPAQAIVIAVPHSVYLQDGAASILKLLVQEGCVVDVKAAFDEKDFPGHTYWRL